MTDSKRYLLLLSLFLTGCLQTATVVNAGPRPVWISEEPLSYPNSSYLYATGSASKAEQAKERAMGNLSKIFEVNIRAVTTTTQDTQSYKAQGEETVTADTRLFEEIRTRSEKMLEGVRIAEQWYNPADLTYYALAVLDRTQAGNNIRSEMNKLDEETQLELNNGDQQTDGLKKIAAHQRALTLQGSRELLQKSMKVIDIRGKGLPAKWNRAELRLKLEKVLNGTRFAAYVANDDIGGTGDVLLGAMSKMGIPATNGEQIDYKISVSTETQPPAKGPGFYLMRGKLTLNLSDAKGEARGNRNWSIKATATQVENLKSRFRTEVDKILKSKLKTTLLDFAGAQD